jgi:hypothetical protein
MGKERKGKESKGGEATSDVGRHYSDQPKTFPSASLTPV